MCGLFLDHRADQPGARALAYGRGHLEGHVGLEQRHLELFERPVHLAGAQLALAQPLRDGRERAL